MKIINLHVKILNGFLLLTLGLVFNAMNVSITAHKEENHSVVSQSVCNGTGQYATTL